MIRRNLLKTHAAFLEQLLRLGDPVWVAAAGIIAHDAYFHGAPLPDNYLFAALAGAALCLAAFPMFNLYRPQRGISLVVEIGALLNAWLVVTGCGLAFLFATK